MRQWIRTILAVCVFMQAAFCFANQRANVVCAYTGPIVTFGSQSSNVTGVVYPYCQVAVYIANTSTLATIYSDNSNTALANPFAASNLGLGSFYAALGRYDITISACTTPSPCSGTPLPSPLTTGDVVLQDLSAVFTAPPNTPVLATNGSGVVVAATQAQVLNTAIPGATVTGSGAGQNLTLTGSENAINATFSGTVAAGSSSTPSYPASISNTNQLTPYQFNNSRYGRTSATSLHALTTFKESYDYVNQPDTVIPFFGSSVGVGATLADPANQAPCGYFANRLNALFPGVGGKGYNFRCANMGVNGSTTSNFPAAWIEFTTYALSGVTINTAGTGYAVGDWEVVNQASANQPGGAVIVSAISAGGVPTALKISPYPGCITSADTFSPTTSLYSVASNIPTTNGSPANCAAAATQVGTGSGLTVNITSVGYSSFPIAGLIYGMNDRGPLIFNSGQTLQGGLQSLSSALSTIKAAGADPIVFTTVHPAVATFGSSLIAWNAAIPCSAASAFFMSVCDSVHSGSGNTSVADPVASFNNGDFAGLGTAIKTDSRATVVNDGYRAVAANPQFTANVVDSEKYWFEAVECLTAPAGPSCLGQTGQGSQTAAETLLFPSGQSVHPGLLGHQLSYQRSIDDFLTSYQRQTSQPSAPSDFINAAKGAQNTHTIPSTGASPAWVYLGTWGGKQYGGNGADLLPITIVSGLYGATESESATFLTLELGNNTTAPNITGMRVDEFGTSTVTQVEAYATGGSTSTTNTSFDIYAFMAANSPGIYTVNVQSAASWTPASIIQNPPATSGSAVYTGKIVNTVNAAGDLLVKNVTVIPGATVTGYHGTSGTKVQLSDNTGTSGNCAKYASDGSVTDAGAPCIVGAAWSQTTPTVTCASGTPTNITAVLRSSVTGKTAFVSWVTTDTTNGTCSGQKVTLPFTAKSASALVCGTAAAGLAGWGLISAGGTSVEALSVAGANLGGDGVTIQCSGVVEVQ